MWFRYLIVAVLCVGCCHTAQRPAELASRLARTPLPGVPAGWLDEWGRESLALAVERGLAQRRLAWNAAGPRTDGSGRARSVPYAVTLRIDETGRAWDMALSGADDALPSAALRAWLDDLRVGPLLGLAVAEPLRARLRLRLLADGRVDIAHSRLSFGAAAGGTEGRRATPGSPEVFHIVSEARTPEEAWRLEPGVDPDAQAAHRALGGYLDLRRRYRARAAGDGATDEPLADLEARMTGAREEAVRALAAALGAPVADTPHAPQALLVSALLRAEGAMEAYHQDLDRYELALAAAEPDAPPGGPAPVPRLGPALAQLKERLARWPDAPLADYAGYLTGLFLARLERDIEAAGVWQRFLVERPGSAYAPEVGFRLGEHRFRYGEFPQATRAYAAALEPPGPLRPSALFKLGWSHFEANEYELGVRRLVELLASADAAGATDDGMLTDALSLLIHLLSEADWDGDGRPDPGAGPRRVLAVAAAHEGAGARIASAYLAHLRTTEAWPVLAAALLELPPDLSPDTAERIAVLLVELAQRWDGGRDLVGDRDLQRLLTRLGALVGRGDEDPRLSVEVVERLRRVLEMGRARATALERAPVGAALPPRPCRRFGDALAGYLAAHPGDPAARALLAQLGLALRGAGDVPLAREALAALDGDPSTRPLLALRVGLWETALARGDAEASAALAERLLSSGQALTPPVLERLLDARWQRAAARQARGEAAGLEPLASAPPRYRRHLLLRAAEALAGRGTALALRGAHDAYRRLLLVDPTHPKNGDVKQNVLHLLDTLTDFGERDRLAAGWRLAVPDAKQGLHPVAKLLSADPPQLAPLPAPTPAPQPPPRVDSEVYGRSWAVIVGIDQYDDWTPLEFAVADARRMESLLRRLGFDEVITLVDDQATRRSILSLLGTRLAQEVDRNDRVVIFFAGHGQTEKRVDGGSMGWVLPVDTVKGNEFATAISMDDLRSISARLRAKHILYVMDSCYSGLGLQRARGARSPSNDYLHRVAHKRAVQMLTAGRADEQAWERGGHGVFTRAVLEGLLEGSADQDGDGIVFAQELADHVRREVRTRTEGKQSPVFGTLAGAGENLFDLSALSPAEPAPSPTTP